MVQQNRNAIVSTLFLNNLFNLDLLVINSSLQIVRLQFIIFFHSVPLTNKIQTHSPCPVSHIDDIKMVRRCKDLLQKRKTFLTNYTQEKNHTYQHVQRCSSSQHFPGLHKAVLRGLYSYFRIFRAIYINPHQIYRIWTSSKTRNDSKSLSITKRNINSTQYF